jgi:hypothetical protein
MPFMKVPMQEQQPVLRCCFCKSTNPCRANALFVRQTLKQALENISEKT